MAATAPRRAPAPRAADWIDLLALLRADEGRPAAELGLRDRVIGRELAAWRGRPVAQLVAWVRAVRGSDAAAIPAAPSLRLAALALAAGGFLFGVAAASGAFVAGPAQRINVAAVLGLLVAVQWIFLALAAGRALPPRARRFLPWIGSESGGGGPLQLARAALRWLPARQRSALSEALGRGRALGHLSAPVRRWLLLCASQGAAVCFNLGALAATLSLVVFTDLSFGWSTTLDADSRSVHRVTSALAAPWSRLWPAAVPSVGLIETTRTFRIAAQPDPSVAPEAYGGWWRFLLMALGVYALAPRLAFFGLARWRLARALRRALREAPGAQRVLDRLNSPLVETHPRERGPEAPIGAAGEPAQAAVALPERAVVLCWADAVAGAAAARTLGCEPAPWLEAGGHRRLDDDARAVEQAAAAGDSPVVLAVRGFEPPLLEVADFLVALRRGLGDARPILVAPVGGSSEERERWRRFLGGLGDPWLALALPRAEVA